MLKKFISTKFRIRVVIVVAATIFLYAMSIYSLFISKDIFQSLIFVFLFFLSFHFFFIEAKKHKTKYFISLCLIISIILSIIIWFEIWQYRVSILVFNVGILALIFNIQVPLKKEITFNTISYMSIWWYIFTVFVSITYSFALAWMYRQFPFSCEDLSKSSDSVIDFFVKPFKIWFQKAEEIKTQTQDFLTANLKDTIFKKIKISDNQTWSKNIIDEYRDIIINQVFEDNRSINIWICDYMLWEINKRYNKPAFQFSLIFLMYLLLYPFLRIIFWIMTAIWIFLFKILLKLNIYKIKKVLKEVEELE